MERDVLDVTLALLAEHGYDFSVDDVAARAGVHKTTVYRRWDTKPALVAAALDRLAGQTVPSVDSGDPIADLRTLALQVAAALRRPEGRNALKAAFTAAGANALPASTAGEFLASRYQVATRRIRAAQAAGHLRPDIDPTLMWQAVVNPLHVNAVTGGPLDDETALALIELVLTGAGIAGDRRRHTATTATGPSGDA